MKKFLPFFSLMFLGLIVNAQCDDLFFSEYVEGYANNKALEIYNPTNAAIDLSGYAIARFSNGATTAGSDKVIQLPSEMLAAGDVFVVVVDLTDVADWNSQFDKPAWNGYNVVDTIFDSVTGLPVIDEDTGEVLIGPQYEEGSAIFGDVYDETYDLQCKADAFLCPDYGTNNAMYFNGNDAMALITGTAIEADGSNIVDVIGVIGEDPTVSIGQDAWVTAEGGWITRDKSIVRHASVNTGRNELNQVIASLGGSFQGEEWTINSKNDFKFLGIHNSVCNAEATPDGFSCANGPFTSVSSINVVPFSVYPNPNSTGSLKVEGDEHIAAVQIINLMGQVVSTQQFAGTQYGEIVDLNAVQKGLYVIKVVFANELISTQKLIVQ